MKKKKKTQQQQNTLLLKMSRKLYFIYKNTGEFLAMKL